jgi:GNAT superfamily N-acetyltransferase
MIILGKNRRYVVMTLRVRDHVFEDLDHIRELSLKTWAHFQYNNEFIDTAITCVFDSNKLVALGYLKHGIGDERDILEINVNITYNSVHELSQLRQSLYETLHQKALDIRKLYPNKLFTLAAWDDYEGDKKYYSSQGFSSFETYLFAKRDVEEIPTIPMPHGLDVRVWMMETEEEKVKYVKSENLYYQGVVYRSVEMLKWMMMGPVLHTLTAFDGEEIAGSVMNWTDGSIGAIDRCFVVPKWRNKGLAKYFITKSLEFHKTAGRQYVHTLVLDSNEIGKGLLKSLGYDSFEPNSLLGLEL